ncbi:MAG: type II toxin-antitoxin system VapC family toxin [Nitrospiria bacterium]
MIYLDASALVKKYVVEDGTERVRTLLRGGRRFFTSKLTYAEVCASVARKYREGGIEKRFYQKAWGSFTKDWEALTLVEVREELFPLIRQLTETHPLRGADAIHLSSALWLGEAIGRPLTFVASDNRLLKSARDEGLEVINPEED